MDSSKDVNTLKIIFADGTDTCLPLWFTNQFDYFKGIIDDLGEDKIDNNGNEYKYMELDFRVGIGSALIDLLSKPTVDFLKRFAYHIEFLGGDFNDDDFDDFDDLADHNVAITEVKPEDVWNSPDGYQTKIILKYITNDKWDELFEIYTVTDYLGNSKICHAISDVLMKYFSNNNLINIENLMTKFNIKSEFTKSQREEILEKFDWRE